ncbi:aldehyde dehydrogenase family protein [Yinghuangia sp. ASG 101]|uniref:aldehyde dehydrogenase family protein n=1 Tax=Yinghuangia sp. ASG 101 TaxID=2896848 RepID=UPI001E5879C7|nr:aldehyde dehydrogenase family protein [Yinghuangia sp. ASG 101]UGQ15709.1 aldehyde dehydrogenase family protein [Yinghuangia sp. ASG 101]
MKHPNEPYIGGRWTPQARTEGFDVTSSATKEVIGRAPAGTTADTDAAVAAARDAFDTGPWPRMAPHGPPMAANACAAIRDPGTLELPPR